MPTWLSGVADILGILSFVFSVAIWFKTDRIRDEIRQQTVIYKKVQSSIIGKLEGMRDNLVYDHLTGLRMRSELRTELMSCRNNFKHLLSRREKYHIRVAIRLLNKGDKLDIERLAYYLDAIIARFKKQEEE